MAEKEDRTLTGGIGNTPPEKRRISGKPENSAQRAPATMTMGRGSPEQTITHALGAGTGALLDKLNWEIGDIIDGRYEVLDVVGQGGKGIVYKVNHLEWRLELAVKMPLGTLVADEMSKLRFIREAQTWVDLGLHPNIVQCWYVRELGGVPRVFMDYLSGGSLRDWIKQGRVRPGEWDKILDLMIQACDGLGYAHEHGVDVHRDVKPGNMLLTEAGELRVTDFGIAKRGSEPELEEGDAGASERGAQATMTMTGSELGTPEYGAPEQWGKARHADVRADIYALGGVLFELCCGRRPFDDNVHREPAHVLIGRHLSVPAPDPRKFNPKLPPELGEIILTCLAKDPEKRPISMTILREILVKLHDKLVGKAYRRQIPKAVELRSDALNNRAVSLLDLGQRAEAFEAWKEALRLDPYHPETIYNQALIEWREGKLTDEDVVRKLEETAHAGRRAALYLGFVQLERAAAAEAEEAFAETLKNPEFAANGSIWRVLGDARIAQEKYEEAEAAYQKTMELIPGDLSTLERQTLAQVKSRQRDELILFPWQYCRYAFERGHERDITAAAIAPNGRLAASGSHDLTVRVWDLAARAAVWTFKGHEESVTAVAFTPDSRFVLSGSADRALRIWEIASGKLLRVFRGHVLPVTALAVTPNGRFAVSGSRDKTLRLWNLLTGACVWISEEHATPITAVAITPDGRFVLSGHDEENLYLWDLATGKRVERKYYGSSLDGLGFVASATSALVLTPDGRFMVSGGQGKTIRLWNFKSGEAIQNFTGHEGNVNAVAVTADGRLAASASDDGTLRLWNLETGDGLWTFTGHEGRVTAAAIPPHGQFVLSGGQDATLRQVDLKTGKSPWALGGQDGHEGGVTALALPPQGRFVVSGSKDKTLRLWDVRTAKCLRTFSGHTAEITAVAVTPDGQCALSASRDATLWLWELVSLKKLRRFEGHRQEITALTVTPDGRFALSGSQDSTLRLWDLATARCLRIFTGHAGSITAAAVTPDEHFVISGSADHTLRLWDLATAKCLRVFTGHAGSVSTVAVPAQGRFIVSGSADHTLRLWDFGTAACLRVFTGHQENVTAVALPSDERFMLSGSADKTLRLWDLATARCLRTFSGHKQGVAAVVLTPDGQAAISGSEDGTLRLWNLELNAQRYEATIQVCRQQTQGELLTSTQRFQQQFVWAKAAFASGKAVVAYKHLTRAREIPGYERAPELLALNAALSKMLPRQSLRGKWLVGTLKGHAAGVTVAAVTPDGKFAVSGSKDATLRLWDLTTATCLRVFEGHARTVTGAALSPDGRFVVSSSRDGALRLWDLTSARELRMYQGHKGGVTAVNMTLSGRFIVSGGEDATLRLWNPATMQCLRTFTGHGQSVTAIAVMPDHRSVVSGSLDKTLRLWDATTAKCARIFKGHKEGVLTVAVAANGEFMLSGSLDKTLRVWEPASGKTLRVLRGHEEAVTAIALSPDGRFAVSGSKDKSLRLWDLSRGECLWAFEQHRQAITAVAMTPDGRFVISGSEDATLQQWEFDWELETKEPPAPAAAKEVRPASTLKNRITSIFGK